MKIRSFIERCAYCVLALLASGAPSIAVSGPIKTIGSTLAIIPTASDSDSSTTGTLVKTESLAKNSFGGGDWTASALVEADGNLEVGVTSTPSFSADPAQAQAFSDMVLSQHFEAGDARIGGIRFTVQPGEILFRTQLNSPLQGEFDGTLFIGLSALINNVVVNTYDFTLKVKSTNGGIDINSGSTGTALVHLTKVLSGPVWGVRTEGFTDALAITPAIFPGDDVSISYSMRAQANVKSVDGRDSFSVKLGDPLDSLSGGGISLITQPPTIPEPSSIYLMIVGCAVIASLRVYKRNALRAQQRTIRPDLA